MIPPAPPLASPRPRPQTLIGEWYRDGWTTPFLCVAFDGVPESCGSLRLKAFRPAVSPDSAHDQTVLLRSGLEVLGQFTFSRQRSEVKSLTLPLPARAQPGPLQISLRVSRRLSPLLPDKRVLGVMLLDLYPEYDV